MQAIKAVKQNYSPSLELLRLLEEFRKMVNDCIRIGLAENTTSLKTLSSKAYSQLARYMVPSYYRLTAISKATGILRNRRRTLRKHPNAKKPYATKLMLTDCYAFKVEDGYLRLPLGNRQYAFIPLNRHTQATISSYTLRSVSLTTCTISITFSRETVESEIKGRIGVDRNLDNITTVTSEDNVQRHDLSEATHIKAMYRAVKSHFKRNDSRIRKHLFRKYGEKERNKVNWLLQNVSKAVVEEARTCRLCIVMEDLKGICKLYQKGNGQGRKFRGRMNSWSFYELQRQIEYKAKWEGLPSIYVSLQKTSSTCAICGSSITECTERQVYCPTCQTVVDRDVNAAKNILVRGLRFKPVGLADEAMVKEPSEEVILKVDAGQLHLQPKG